MMVGTAREEMGFTIDAFFCNSSNFFRISAKLISFSSLFSSSSSLSCAFLRSHSTRGGGSRAGELSAGRFVEASPTRSRDWKKLATLSVDAPTEDDDAVDPPPPPGVEVRETASLLLLSPGWLYPED